MREPNMEAVNGVLSREVRKLQEELKAADRRIAQLEAELIKHAPVPPMSMSVSPAPEPSLPDLDPDRLMVDPPSGWRYGFPKRIPREHQNRTIEWMIEQGYPRYLTEQKHFYVRYWNAEESTND